MTKAGVKKRGTGYQLLGLASIIAVSFFTKDFLGGIREIFRWKK